MANADPISVQLYSLRNFGDLEAQLDAVAAAGYRHVETIQSHLDDPAGFARRIAAHGLDAPTGHVGMQALRERLDWVIDGAQTIGIQEIFMPALPPEERGGDAAHWRRVGAELGTLAERIAARGLRFGYHNHHWEMADVGDGQTALTHLFAGAGQAPLHWQIDVAWVVRGGGDPLAWLDRERARITAAHVKDIAPDGENLDQDGWADVGHGTLDWRALWRACRDAGAAWMVVEHDNPRDAAASVAASRAFLAPLAA